MAHTLEQFAPEEAARALQELEPDDAAPVLARMDGWFAARTVACPGLSGPAPFREGGPPLSCFWITAPLSPRARASTSR